MDDTEQAIATLRAYAADCHDEIALAGARLCDAYMDGLALWAAQMFRQMRLEDENARLRAALAYIRDTCEDPGCMWNTAAEALDAQKG